MYAHLPLESDFLESRRDAHRQSDGVEMALVPPAITDLISERDFEEEEEDMLVAITEEPGDLPIAVPPGGASLIACTLNLANSIMGAGILGIPFAIRSVGSGWGVALFLAVGSMSAFTMHLLVASGALVGVASYEEVAGKAFGTPGRVFLELVMIASVLGVLTAYLVLLGDFLSPVLCPYATRWAVFGLLLHRRVILTLLAGMLLPLSLVRNLATLRGASGLSIALMALFALMLGYRSLSPFDVADVPHASPPPHDHPMSAPYRAALHGLPIMTFAFSSHVCVFPVYNSLCRPSPRRISAVIAGAMLLCLALYSVVAFLGARSFGASTCPNLLNNFAALDPLAALIRMAFTVCIVTTYPLILFAARRALDLLLFTKPAAQGQGGRRNFVETVALVTASLLLATLAPGVRPVFALSGAAFATVIAFVAPSACYIKLTPHTDLRMWAAVVVLVSGLALGALSTWANVQMLMEGDLTVDGCQTASACATQRLDTSLPLPTTSASPSPLM